MNTETQPDRAALADDIAIPEEAETTSHRPAYKTVLAAVVIGSVTIALLWLLVVRQAADPADTALATALPVSSGAEAKAPKDTASENRYRQIDQRLMSLSDRIGRGFKLQQAYGVEVKHYLQAMAESLQTIKTAVADLEKSNQALGRRIRVATSKLDTLARGIRKLRVAKHKSPAKPRPRHAKRPPFRIDAIDIWDDMSYVAISQAGRVAFLRAGEQQSGWTVTRIDRLKGKVDFRGPAGQVHSVSLQR